MSTRQSARQAIEWDYVQLEESDLVVAGGQEAFAAVLAEFINDEELQAHLSAGAGESAEHLGLPYTVRACDAAVEALLPARSAGDA